MTKYARFKTVSGMGFNDKDLDFIFTHNSIRTKLNEQEKWRLYEYHGDNFIRATVAILLSPKYRTVADLHSEVEKRVSNAGPYMPAIARQLGIDKLINAHSGTKISDDVLSSTLEALVGMAFESGLISTKVKKGKQNFIKRWFIDFVPATSAVVETAAKTELPAAIHGAGVAKVDSEPKHTVAIAPSIATSLHAAPQTASVSVSISAPFLAAHAAPKVTEFERKYQAVLAKLAENLRTKSVEEVKVALIASGLDLKKKPAGKNTKSIIEVLERWSKQAITRPKRSLKVKGAKDLLALLLSSSAKVGPST